MERLRLGFLTNVPFSSEAGGARRGLEEALELFELADELGFDSGWVRQRHFDNYLASPLVLLTAVARATSRIRLGTAVISVRYEDPIRLAEDAATVDLLSDGRLELGLAGGIPGWERLWGTTQRDHRSETQDRLRRLRVAIAGDPVQFDGADGTEVPDLRARPHSPGLGERIWYGAGSAESAARAGEQGLDLLLSTLNHSPTNESFEESQRDNILAHRQAWTGGDRRPRACVSRLFMPAVNSRQRRLYADFDALRRAEGPAGPRPSGALAPDTFAKVAAATAAPMPSNIQLCPIYHGDPDSVLAAARADTALEIADELMIWLPPNFTATECQELLENTIDHIARPLGWSPNAAVAAA